jgi:hypothetical protein
MIKPFLVRFLAIIVAGLFFTQCTFDSDEKFFNDLPLPDPAAVGVMLSTVNLSEYEPGETVDIFGTTSFSVLTNGQHGEIESFDVFLADEEISMYGSVNAYAYSDRGHFTLPLNLLTNGTFSLRLEFTMRTASGSLADQLATERFKVIQQWSIRVDLSPPTQPTASIAMEDGFLTLRWSPYSKPNFQSYRITRRWGTGTQTSTVNITDSLITHWKDESYVGGYSSPVRYTVSVVSETGMATSLTMEQYNPSNARYSFNAMDSTVTVRWTPTSFYGTFQDYRFSGGLSAFSERISITNITDSIFTYKLRTVRFGGVTKVAFEIRSRLPEITTGGPVGECELGTAFPVSGIVPITFNAYLQTYVTVDANKKLLELNDDFENVRELATLSGTAVTIPYPGNYVYYANTSHTAPSNNLARLDLEDNSVLTLNGTYAPNLYLYSGASNGLVCYDYTRIPVPSNNIPALFVARVTDPEGVGDVYYESSGTVNVGASISDDGRFIWANGRRVFKISDGSSTLIGTVPGTMTFHGFRKDYCDQMIFQEANRIYIYDANTLILIRSIEVPTSAESLYVGSYDVQTKTMLCSTSFPTTNLHLINMDNGERKTIAASRDMNTSEVYLVNGKLIYGGKYIKVL